MQALDFSQWCADVQKLFMLSRCFLLSLGFSLGSVSTSSVLRFREGEVGVQAGIVCLFSQEFRCTAPEELAGVYRSEGNNCSIDFQRQGFLWAEPH